MRTYVSGLLGPRMKTDRAAAQLKELQARCTRFKTNPYAVSEQDDPKRGLYIVTIHLREMDNEVPLLIGEFAHSLRSALDHLAWQLVLSTGRTPSRSSCFPLHSSDSSKDRERLMRVTWDMPCEAIELIKSFQPHLKGKGMKSYPLWQLNKLSNLDKHQTIGYNGTVVQWRFVTHGVPEPPFTIDENTHEVSVLIPIAHKGKVGLKFEPPDLVFGKPIDVPPKADFALSEADIAEIHRYVSLEVLPKFERFFAHK